MPCPRHRRELLFERVSFEYQPGTRILDDVTLRIPFGETIAIVGPNGCGKSTLANLIPRFADPIEGQIRLDGVPLTDLRLRELRGQIGLVTQEPLLVRRHGVQQYPLRPTPGQPRRGDRSGQAGPRPRLHRRGTDRRLRDRGGHARRPAIGRPAAAHCLGPRDPARPGDLDPRRGHQPDRPGERAGDPGSAGGVHPWADRR